ncbi:unnamed protein product [Didymodactylos carnosus]|uniref:Disease resistance R13L4/SHOC-2-like LRR domain-containing protein n=1 Tax=Didymodactylos carnosus TaxID=1234261 RepID=A0A815XR18_9BILA|nr:unnamed protein product [Didymodactylos carnosus]CAF4421919.1 unnamed protein product [Didymodactylos carnosus]
MIEQKFTKRIVNNSNSCKKIVQPNCTLFKSHIDIINSLPFLNVSYNLSSNLASKTHATINSQNEINIFYINHEKQFSSNIYCLISLEKLIINFVDTTISSEIKNLNKLIELEIGYNQVLSSIPNEIGQLRLLKILKIHSCPLLRTLPDDMKHLTNLISLTVEYSSITKIPTFIRDLTVLETLYLYNNKITVFWDTIAGLTRLKHLDLNFNPLTSISANIRNIPRLQGLQLRGCNLKYVPNFITQLYSLTTLDLSGNSLVSLPLTFIHLQKLHWLHLGSNKFQQIPREILLLYKLEYLFMSYNSISSLSGLGILKTLKSLDLRGNQLCTIPEEIENLVSLTELNLSDNYLSHLSTELLTGIQHLSEVYLYNNLFSDTEHTKIKNLLKNTSVFI